MRLEGFADDDATRRFDAELYLEHLEEASFLYEQKRVLYDDPEVTWLRIEEFEKRLEAHVDALVWGEEAALETCRLHVKDGEAGELYTAVAVFCRAGRRDLLGPVLKDLDPDNAARWQAASDAMKDEMPREWAQALAGNLARGYEKLIPLLACYSGYRRVATGGALIELIDRVPATGLAEVLWGLGRMAVDDVAPQVAGYLRHEDATIRANAAIALLRRGDARAVTACRERALRGDRAMCLPLAVSGRRSDAAVLQSDALLQAVAPELLIAWGVLGEFSVVGLLVDRLTDGNLAAAAAAALQLITGADLWEEAFIPEVVEEDELFEEERQVYRETGEVPQHSDGRPFGVTVDRPSQDPVHWQKWLEEHEAHFDASQRYRFGKPFSLSGLVDTLVSPSCGRQVRSLAYEELVVRYGIDVPFEVEMRVTEQKKQINEIARLCRSREASFQPGRWYFAGH